MALGNFQHKLYIYANESCIRVKVPCIQGKEGKELYISESKIFVKGKSPCLRERALWE